MATEDNTQIPEHKLRNCENCCAQEDRPRQFLQCKNCKYACYCGESCQKANWKVHKKFCKDHASCIAKYKAPETKRSFRLYSNWLPKVQRKVAEAVQRYMGTSSLLDVVRNRDVVLLEVKFHFNYLTFMPTAAPVIRNMEDSPDQAIVEAKYANQQGLAAQHPDCEMALVRLVPSDGKNPISHMPITFRRNYPGGDKSWQEVLPLFAGMTQTSSLFPSWKPLRKSNVDLQLRCIQAHESFFSFLVAALRMESSTPLNLKSVVVINIEFGFGLGEIVQLAGFSLMPMAEMRAHVKRFLPDDQARQTFEEDHFLVPQKSKVAGKKKKKKAPKTVSGLVSVFLQNGLGDWFFGNRLEVGTRDFSRRFSSLQCDATANRKFAELRQIPLPAVASPGLND